MPEDTALLERQDTAPPAEATLPEGETESEELDTGAETGDVEDSTETDEGQDLASDPRVIALIAEKVKATTHQLGESFRQREENARKAERESATEAAYTALHRSVDATNAATSYSQIRTVMQKMFDDGDEPKAVEGQVWAAVQENYKAGIVRGADAILEAANAVIDPDLKRGWSVPTEINDAFKQAQGTLDTKGMIAAVAKAIEAATIDRVRDSITKEVTESLTKGQALKATEEARKSLPRPTNTTGAPVRNGRTFRTQSEVDTAFYKGEIDMPTVKMWMSKGLPYQ